MIGDSGYRVVRRLGSNATHVARLTLADLEPVVIAGAHAHAVAHDPVDACCGSRLRRGAGSAVVAMVDARVSCRPCREVSGVRAVEAGSIR